MDGKGKKMFPSGGLYEGDFREGLPHGKGKRTWSDGTMYEGEFNEGLCQGNGKCTWPSGESYEGDWDEGKGTGKDSMSVVMVRFILELEKLGKSVVEGFLFGRLVNSIMVFI